MEKFTPGEVTQLLVDVRSGSQSALNTLLPLVYDELRKIASSCLRQEYQQRTIQTCDLVHETYIRLVGQDVSWQNRAHFFGIAANAMRQILVDYARRRKADKRGGGMTRVSLNEDVVIVEETFSRLLMLDDALSQLQKFDERLCKVVELRYFSGLTVEETAEVLSVSPRTVKNDWSLAKAWLHRTIHA
jgi:RNA polymerase sigma factor (TIGR02999 family)